MKKKVKPKENNLGQCVNGKSEKIFSFVIIYI